jgi:hypothetical protein
MRHLNPTIPQHRGRLLPSQKIERTDVSLMDWRWETSTQMVDRTCWKTTDGGNRLLDPARCSALISSPLRPPVDRRCSPTTSIVMETTTSFLLKTLTVATIRRYTNCQYGASLRAQEEPDLLISGDSWFRPVDLRVGPDRALYVADFYNRILGHYEVKLNHPGRDRHRGRVWKIEYTGDPNRRDAGAIAEASSPLQSESASDVFAQLASDNQTIRMTATDRLVDHFSTVSEPLAQAGLQNSHETVRAHSLWILQRLEKMTDAQLAAAVEDSAELVRIHAFRVLLDRSDFIDGTEQILLNGFADSSATVRRVTVHAAAKHPHAALISPLAALYASTPANDVHLRHSFVWHFAIILLTLVTSSKQPQRLE